MPSPSSHRADRHRAESGLDKPESERDLAGGAEPRKEAVGDPVIARPSGAPIPARRRDTTLSVDVERR